MANRSRHVVLIVSACVIAVVFGGVGAGLVVWSPSIFQFDLGTFFGGLLAAWLAFRFGLQGYLAQRQREARDRRRDAWARRYLEEGLDPVCRSAADDCERGLANAAVARHLLRLAATNIDAQDRGYVDAIARLRSGPVGLSHDHIRVLMAFGDDELFRLLSAVGAGLRINDEFFNAELPFTLDNIVSYPVERRDGALANLATRVTEAERRAFEFFAFVPIGLVNLANAVQDRLYRDDAGQPEQLLSDHQVKAALRACTRHLRDMLQRLNLPIPVIAEPRDAENAVR